MTASFGVGTGFLLTLLFGAPAAPAVEAGAQEMEQVVGRFVQAWASEDTTALQELLASTVHLDVEGQEYLGVPPRQVAASVGRLFRLFAPAAPRVSRQGSLTEGADRGFAEFSWTPAAADTGNTVSFIVIASLRRSDGEWRISELRILQ